MFISWSASKSVGKGSPPCKTLLFYFSGSMSLSSWGNKRPHHWLRVMLLKNGSVLKMPSERFCFALFLKIWGQLDTERTSPDCKCCGGQKEESSLLLDPQPASPRRKQRWCYAALIYGAGKRLLRSFSSRDPTLLWPYRLESLFL